MKTLAINNIDDTRTKNISEDIARTHRRSEKNTAPVHCELWLYSRFETVARFDPEYSEGLEKYVAQFDAKIDRFYHCWI